MSTKTVIDPPIFLAMLNASHARHVDFGILRDWILNNGLAVMGGSKYSEELKKVASVLPFVTELDRRGRVQKCDANAVDTAAAYAKQVANTADFDDEHLIGLIAVAGSCKLICLNDKRAHPYIKNKNLYFRKCSLPKIFSGARSAGLLKKIGS